MPAANTHFAETSDVLFSRKLQAKRSTHHQDPVSEPRGKTLDDGSEHKPEPDAVCAEARTGAVSGQTTMKSDSKCFKLLASIAQMQARIQGIFVPL